MDLFYAPGYPENAALPQAEAKHAVKVLRKTVGDTIAVTNGRGMIFHCEITALKGKSCKINTLEAKNAAAPCRNYLHIAIAPVKNFKRFEWFLEKVTELGIHEITPITTMRSERRMMKRERAEKILVSAMKQSQKGHLPKLNQVVDLREFIPMQSHTDQKFIAHNADQSVPLAHRYDASVSTLVLVGPEGDFSAEELKLCVEKGFVPITLGQHRLRTETAGVVACAAIHTLNNMT